MNVKRSEMREGVMWGVIRTIITLYLLAIASVSLTGHISVPQIKQALLTSGL